MDLGERIAAATERRLTLAGLLAEHMTLGEIFAGIKLAPPSQTIDEFRVVELNRLGVISDTELAGCYELKFTAPAARRSLSGATVELAKVAKGAPSVKSA